MHNESHYQKLDNGEEFWYDDNGNYHRTDGPAYIYHGSEWWYFHGKQHRVGGPAYESINGVKVWYFNDQRHRIDGPAVIVMDGIKQYWYKGERISEKVYYSDEFQCKVIMEL